MRSIYCIIRLLREKSFFVTVIKKINTVIAEIISVIVRIKSVIIRIKSVIVEIKSVIILLLSNNNFTMQYIYSPNIDKTTKILAKNLCFCSLFHMKPNRKRIVNLLFK